jgi:beta-lactamase regulating signal transducer with metallopeptidase domain
VNSLNWFQIILSLSLQATLLTALACAIERRCTAAPVKARIWSCYYLGLLGLLAAGLLTPRAYWFNPWQRLSDDELMRVVSFEQSAAGLLLAAWLTGLAYFAIRWVVQSLQLHQFLRTCRLATPAEDRLLRATASAELLESAGRSVEFRICPEDLGPFCYQLHQPTVYLPPSLMTGSLSELRHVLQHELTHLKTQHPLQVFAQRIVQTALWFVPFVWTAGRRASLAREFVCDDAAVDHGASTASYLRTLLRYAKEPNHGAAVLAIARSSSELRVRAQRLARPDSIARTRLGDWAPSIILLTSLAASQAWLPTNPLASPKASYSPWPAWSAAALHAFDVSVRDFDQFDGRLQIHELSQDR